MQKMNNFENLSEEMFEKASDMTKRYNIEFDISDPGRDTGFCSELPMVVGSGETLEECEKDIRQSIQIMVAYMIKNDMELPSPVGGRGIASNV